MKRYILGAAGSLVLVLGMASLPTGLPVYAHPSHSTEASAVPLLPGEAVWNGAPSFDFGANDGVNWDPQYNMDVAPDASVIQGDLKAAGVPIARTWFFQNSLVDQHAMTDAEQLQKLQAVKNAGMVCFANFPTENTVAYDLHLLSILSGACPYVEVMNEPDIEKAPWNNGQQIDPTAYLNFWNSLIPQARATYPGVLFGGPAEYDDQGDYCTYNGDGTSECFLQKVMLGMKASGNLPDFITYHWYPCWNDSASTCLSKSGTFASAAQQVIGWADSIFGTPIPVICSEWNADPGNPSYMMDRNWDAQYVTAATQNIETSGLSGAMEFDISSYGNYSADDLFDIYSGGQPFATFTAYAAELARVRGGGPVTTPTSLPTAQATATAQAPTATPAPPVATATYSTAATPTPAIAVATGTPSSKVPSGGPLGFVQSLSSYAAATMAPRAAFAQPVTAHDGLIATIAVASGGVDKPDRVATVTDSLGNAWERVATGTATGTSGNAMEADIWYTSARTSGSDMVTATLADGTADVTSLRALVTLAEVRGPITPHGGAAAASSGKWHTSGNLSASASDMLVGMYVSTGGDRGTAVGDGKSQLGAVCIGTGGLQGDQSYGRGNTAVFTTVSSTAAVGVVAAFSE